MQFWCKFGAGFLTVFSYKISVGTQTITISAAQFDELRDAMMEHVQRGFRDGETRRGSVVITEIAGQTEET